MASATGTTTQPGQTISANGLNMYYEEYGSGEPLVLVHGGLGTSADWAPQIPLLSKHYQVFVPDSRGHGKTNNPSGELSYRLMADDLAAFIHGLGLNKPLVCGYSDGGQIALELGMRYPGLAKALVVGAAWFSYSEEHLLKPARAFGFEGPRVVNFERAEEVMGQGLHKHHPQDPDYWKTLLIQISVVWLTPLGYTAQDFERIVAPALILVGDRDDFIPLEEAVSMYRLMPNAELAVAPNSNHDFPGRRPELFTNLVLDFLLRHGTQAQ